MEAYHKFKIKMDQVTKVNTILRFMAFNSEIKVLFEIIFQPLGNFVRDMISEHFLFISLKYNAIIMSLIWWIFFRLLPVLHKSDVFSYSDFL